MIRIYRNLLITIIILMHIINVVIFYMGKLELLRSKIKGIIFAIKKTNGFNSTPINSDSGKCFAK